MMESVQETAPPLPEAALRMAKPDAVAEVAAGAPPASADVASTSMDRIRAAFTV
ncbi:hypothetical protein D3C83_306920 [compost metagenome]